VVAPGKHLTTKVEGVDIKLPLDQATSLALVINELVQNAVEHGFKVIDDGRILINLEEVNDEVIVRVFNDGEELPSDFEPAETSSLGLRIVTDLVRGGLGGTFTMENSGGILATVRFPRRQ
ncbi:MAG: sensor histidine kinase, partial [Chthonomonadales bacterium]